MWRPLRLLVPFAATLVLSGAGPAGVRDWRPPEDAPHERLARALAALGGRERLESAAAWHVEGRGRENLAAELQGLAPGRPTWRPHRERVAVDTRALTVTWERRTPRNDWSVRWRRFVHAADSLGVYDWSAGRGGWRPGGVAESRRRALARRVPHLLLLEAAGGAIEPGWCGAHRFEGGWVDELQLTLPSGEVLRLGLRRTAPQLVSASYRVELPGAGVVPVEWRWHGWRPTRDGGLAPAGHVVLVDGVPFQEVTYTRYGPDAVRAAAALAIPADRAGPRSEHVSALGHGASGVPRSGEVAPGLHVLEFGGFGVMVAEFHDFLVAMEAPERHPGLEAIPATRDSASVTAEFLAAIRARWPGKPVRFAILSHHHSDHLGGARELARAGATLLVAPGHAAAARRAIGDVVAHRAPGAIEPVTAPRRIADGARTLEVIPVGANPHTDEALFAWFPAERVLFQGDLFYFDEGSPFPPSGRRTMNRFFARWLVERGLSPRAIYGVHGRGGAGEDEWRAMLASPSGPGARARFMAPRR